MGGGDSVTFEDVIRKIVQEEFQNALTQLKQELALSNKMDEILTVEETAKLMKISKVRVYELARHHDFPAIRDGKKVRIHTQSLMKWLESKAIKVNCNEAL